MSESTHSKRESGDTARPSAERTTVRSSEPAPSGPTGTVFVDPDATVDDSAVLSSVEAVGDFIGRYKLIEKIGEGGFGLVYEAEQTEPVKRRVALKIIKLGMDTRQVVARFEAERQALAMMDHPNIARVLDAGATETGRPYFVMEFVRGTKITEYCDQNKLSTRKRLNLFMQVCRAIEHAHQKGIIHRDIKPSNIIVTVNDGVPVPKVIDFGIAKAMQGTIDGKAAFTLADQFIGTPAYMSPEQAEGGGMDIDTRSDIYSLGVLLYELLTGETPLESKSLLSRGFDEMRKIIREWEPQPPSIRLHKKSSEDQTTTAKRHGTDAPKLIKIVRGDLDWVVMKCLEKDRSRRYDSAAELGADIQRFLTNEPVTARPPSKIYRFQKMVLRNRLAFATASAILASLIIALCVSAWFVVKEKQERDLAEKASRDSDNARRIAEEALTQAEAARKQSDVDLQHTEVARQQSSLDRSRAVAAEQKAADSQKAADLARQQATAALEQAREARDKASAAEKVAADARQEAESATARALAEAAQRDEALKSAGAESALRKQAEAALAGAMVARQKAEAAEASAVAEASESRETISNYLEGLDALPPVDALMAADIFSPANDGKQPWAGQLWRQRGEWSAREGEWEDAMTNFSRALDLDPGNPKLYDALAALSLQRGDGDGLRQICARFLARFGATHDPAIDRMIARDFLLTPLPGTDIGPAVALARRLAAAGTNDDALCDSQLTFALAEYRQGHYAGAAEWADKAWGNSGRRPGCEAEACGALALAQQQLQQNETARQTLARARTIIDTKLPKLESGDLGPQWNQWIAANALAREAAAATPAPPSTNDARISVQPLPAHP
jgi:serine/threonine protein kinase